MQQRSIGGMAIFRQLAEINCGLSCGWIVSGLPTIHELAVFVISFSDKAHACSCRVPTNTPLLDRFVVTSDEGKPQIRLELFHETVPSLRSTKIEFEVLSGTTADQARTLVGELNEMILGVIVTPKG